MAATILYGDTQHSASMRHEVPISIGDPFLVIVDGERTWISCSPLEAERVAACRPDAELLDSDDLGFHELLESGLSRDEVELELVREALEGARALARPGVTGRELLLITKHGCERLTEFPYQLRVG